MGSDFKWLPPGRQLTMEEQLRIRHKLLRVRDQLDFDMSPRGRRDMEHVQAMLFRVGRGELYARDIATIHALLTAYTPEAVIQA